ncbi:hypothetical protein CH253_08350 [Rhodococcus sp. 06-156-3C]|uniref:hypothetical protein n=1 Tax=Rhodococcus sp. 06-156-3C TaxID=2022486 RepID=UPI000B9BCA84|nr:hypothetical protein [Rhodococcus sp. 06-156-3C]OZD23857.1 hypothetical protein CH253_08350 [Rhodococcus sp. 06-156-3C]
MADEVRSVSLSEQFDPGTPEYVNARLLELERLFQQAPSLLREGRRVAREAKEALAVAEAHAGLAAARNAELTNEAGRKAQVLIDTTDERSAWQTADAAFKFLEDKVHQYGREKDALQTRSANLRAEMALAGQGQR